MHHFRCINLLVYYHELSRNGGRISYAVGHLSLGYIIGKSAEKLLKTEVNIPLIFALSVIPDIDILMPPIEHRGPTHSIIAALIIFIPIFASYGRKASPYLLAIIQHPLIGDYFAGGKIQLFWPITTDQYGIEIGIKNPINVSIELIAFTVSILIMLKIKDIHKLLHSQKSILLTVPIFTLVSPTFLKFPTDVPAPLIPPHLIFTIIFLIPIITQLKRLVFE